MYLCGIILTTNNMSYLNKPLSLTEQRELLRFCGVFLKRDIQDGQFVESSDESPIKDGDILYADVFGITIPTLETLESFLKWKESIDNKTGEEKKQIEIQRAIGLLRSLGIQSIS